ncbi:MAG TPA: formate dehydrogenase accessory sulfurtransferase FdhD [Bacteroidia bacterium]|nr:formate dehydrogenase accessory sulfurtransferase FdhD [Bacteroidia bacterium]
MALSVTHKKIRKISNGSSSVINDLLAVEEPMEIKINYFNNTIPIEKNISVTMRTPGNDFELAAGFLFTEGIIKNSSDIEQISYCKKALHENNENVIKVILKQDASIYLNSAERNFYITGSCGVCGKASIESIMQQSQFSCNLDFQIPIETIFNLVQQMKDVQINFKHTGGIHACGLYDQEGKIILVREDVGRHNALDKLIGKFVLENKLPLHHYILLLSGRISFELVQKAAMVGINVICGVGAPSSLAIETAEKFGITVIGFLREGSMNIYTHELRIIA